jgi:hypothetical protein
MVVHYVRADWEDAKDRFLGPVKLLDRARALLLELMALPTMPSVWKPWVDALEASGRLVPVLRWRVPEAALLWLWANHDGRTEDMQALQAEAALGVNALAAWDQARHAWTRDPQWARSAHPLDEHAGDWAMLVESPADVAWTPRTYASLRVRTLWTGHDHLDENRCVPLFRGWQALLLAEHVLAEPRHFPPRPMMEGGTAFSLNQCAGAWRRGSRASPGTAPHWRRCRGLSPTGITLSSTRRARSPTRACSPHRGRS